MEAEAKANLLQLESAASDEPMKDEEEERQKWAFASNGIVQCNT